MTSSPITKIFSKKSFVIGSKKKLRKKLPNAVNRTKFISTLQNHCKKNQSTSKRFKKFKNKENLKNVAKIYLIKTASTAYS